MQIEMACYGWARSDRPELNVRVSSHSTKSPNRGTTRVCGSFHGFKTIAGGQPRMGPPEALLLD
jgi:hypothetical protein